MHSRGTVSAKPSGYTVNTSGTTTVNGVTYKTAVLKATATTSSTSGEKIFSNVPWNSELQMSESVDMQNNVGINEGNEEMDLTGKSEENQDNKDKTEENKVTQESEKTSDENETNEENDNSGETLNNMAVEIIPQVAQIGEKSYETLALAIQEANENSEITLLENIELKEKILIDQGKNIKLNLNDKNITSTAINTINNIGTLTIVGSGVIKNEAENGIVVNNTGTLNMENGVITTEKNGGKGIYNAGRFYMKNGKIVTQGIGSVSIYNEQNAKVTIENEIVEITGKGSKGIYNNSELEFGKGKILVSCDEGIGVYNSKTSKACNIKSGEITIEAEEIENYELIKDSNEFKQELDQMKPSYGIYNESENPLEIEKATVKAERLKAIGIKNVGKGAVNLGKNDEELNTSLPIIYAISDNTTAVENSEGGIINFFDGKMVTKTSVKDILTVVLEKYEIVEDIGESVVNTMLKLIDKN